MTPRFSALILHCLSRKKMDVTRLAANQSGKGMMALLDAQGRAKDAKSTVKGVHGTNGNVSEYGSMGFR